MLGGTEQNSLEMCAELH